MNKLGFWPRKFLSALLAALAVVLMTLLIKALNAASIANVSLLYLLVVTVAAVALGRGPAVLCSVLSFLALDWYFVEPHYQLTVQTPSEWLALCTFLVVATIVGQLTALLKARMEEAQRSRIETAALAQASWAVASDVDRDRVLKQLMDTINSVTHAQAISLILHDEPNKSDIWIHSNTPIERSLTSPEAIRFVMVHGKSVGWDANKHFQKALSDLQFPGTAHLPVSLDNETFGVLCLKLPDHPIEENERRIVESLVNHAAVVLHRDKLLQVKTKAQALAEVDRLKTALLSMVSHDFRSPLTSIKASVGSLLQEDSHVDQATQLQLLQAVDNETDRLNRLVGNILDLSRLEAQAWAPKRELTPIAELVGPVLDSFSDEENKRIKLDVGEPQEEFWIDTVQMTQVLRNLMENSLKYSDSEVILRMRSNQSYDLLEVLDNGPGLPKGEEQDIFKPFFRAARFQESSKPGMGVGLAVCKGLVEAHHGKLVGTNRDGGGAVFSITLPKQPVNGDENVLEDISH